MKINKKTYDIGFLPDKGRFKGGSPKLRIKNYASKLNSKKDKKDFLLLQKLIDKSLFEAAKIMFWDLDTAVRDTFYNVYTNNDKSKAAALQLIEIFQIKRRFYFK